MRATGPVAAVWATAAGVAVAQSSACAEGLYIIVARGTGEPEGMGDMGELAQRIADRIPGSRTEGLEYPATFINPIYDDSVDAGAETLRELIVEYHEECPDSQIALLGYSQGAHVTGEVICGGSSGTFSNIAPLPADVVEESIAAVVMFGDPAHNPDASFNRGTSDNDGIFIRQNITICEEYESRIVSYCDTGDSYCDAGGDREVHGSYTEGYGDEVEDFVVGRYEGLAEGGDDSSSTQTSPSTTATDAPSTTTADTTETTGSDSSSTMTSTTTGPPEPSWSLDPDGAAGHNTPHWLAAVFSVGLVVLLIQ
ncbi:hypothetical protein S40293_05985 [Stachybotrys chartarum IBT 40293]|nr:hypothetical protein S40293_05985 [Stachybotrys chartarum IBT 40293]